MCYCDVLYGFDLIRRRCCNFSFSGLKTAAHILITRVAVEGGCGLVAVEGGCGLVAVEGGCSLVGVV